MRLRLIASATLLFLGCEGSSTLTVDVRTDFVGGAEFSAVQTDVFEGPPDGPRVGGGERAAFVMGRWFEGERVAEVSGLDGDDYSVRVRLLRPDGSTLAERYVRVQARRSYALVVVITRSCEGVTCPGPGDPAVALTCFGGRCVDPRCGADPEACPEPTCEDASTCPRATVPCVRPACVEGACLLEPTGTCAVDEYCDVELGCRELEEPMDAGVADDGGARDASVSDAGVDGGGGCEPGAACDTGEVCSLGTIECLDGEPVCVPSTPAPGDTVCRPAAGPCDAVETCGGALTCPIDELMPAATGCRGSTGECDAAEACTGASVDCPVDGAALDGALCSEGVCIAGACVECSVGLPCVLGPCERGTIDCAGGTPTCTGSSPAAAGLECRAAAGPCDVAEDCSGSSINCPMDRFLGGSTTCRAAVGPCDRADACDGAGAACPLDRYLSASTECRPAVDDCDLAEMCSGTGAGCGGDVLRAGGSECRPASGDCDLPEVCTGSTTACPGDGPRVPGGTECRAAAGICDLAEACDGSGRNCPTDEYVSLGTECRPAGDACNPSEACSGSSPSCPPDDFEVDDTLCGLEACGPYGTCAGTGCDLDMGMRSSTCSTPTCASGSCSGATMRMDTQSCTFPASCGDLCCNLAELGDTCSGDCGPVPVGVTAGPLMYTATVGNPSGIAFEDVCPADTAIYWLSVDYDGSNFFEGMWSYCHDLTFVPDRSGAEPLYRVVRGTTRVLPQRGGNGWTTWECPTGQVLTGFRAALVDYLGRNVIDALEMRCSTINAVGRTMPGVTLTYGAGGTELVDEPLPPPPGMFIGPFDCPAGTVARGYVGAYSTGTPNVLERFGLVCQTITPR